MPPAWRIWHAGVCGPKMLELEQAFFFATLKVELIHRRAWTSRAEASQAVFEWIEVLSNRPPAAVGGSRITLPRGSGTRFGGSQRRGAPGRPNRGPGHADDRCSPSFGDARAALWQDRLSPYFQPQSDAAKPADALVAVLARAG